MLISLLKAAPRILGEPIFGFELWFFPSVFKAYLPSPLVLRARRGKSGGGGVASPQLFDCLLWVVTASLAKIGWSCIYSHARYSNASSHRQQCMRILPSRPTCST